MNKKLEELKNRNVVHEEIGIKDYGPKNTKIGIAVRLQRIHDRIDLIENHRLQDIMTKLDRIATNLVNCNEINDNRYIELTTYLAETSTMLSMHESTLRVIVQTLKNAGLKVPGEIPVIFPEIADEVKKQN